MQMSLDAFLPLLIGCNCLLVVLLVYSKNKHDDNEEYEKFCHEFYEE